MSHVVLVEREPACQVVLPALAQRIARGGIGGHHFQHAVEGAIGCLVAQVDQQRAQRHVGAGRGDQHRRQVVEKFVSPQALKVVAGVGFVAIGAFTLYSAWKPVA